MSGLFFFCLFLTITVRGILLLRFDCKKEVIANPILLSKSNFFIQREFSKWRSAVFFFFFYRNLTRKLEKSVVKFNENYDLNQGKYMRKLK